MKHAKRVCAFVLAGVLTLTGIFAGNGSVSAETCTSTQKREGINRSTKSMAYVKAMGSGWNLGNSMDSIHTDETEPDRGEESWGNPKVTKKLLKEVKKKGYKSIRIPLTFYRRYTVNNNAKDGEYKYVINEDYLNRAKEIVDWALDDGFYVVTNIHHDSWIWLKNWDGKTTSEEYRMYTDFYKQLAETFKNESDKLVLETINEYSPEDSEGVTAQEKVMAINKAGYDIIRSSGGSNATRMILLPTLYDNHEEKNSSVLRKFIDGLNDENVIASIHYYCEWVYSANLGRTGFDEDLFGNGNYSPRNAIDSMMSTLREQFLNDGIGVIVGEYGLLGYDQGDNVLQTGEEIKYYDYMNKEARENNVCLMFWDNGSGIDRNTYKWKQPRVGAALESAMKGRVSYATGLDTVYLSKKTASSIRIPLTLNGNKFKSIKGLKKGRDYTYNSKKAVVTLKKSYVKKLLKKASYGQIADLTIRFNSGSDWHEYLVYNGKLSFQAAKGTTEQIAIPAKWNGSDIRRISVTQDGKAVGPNSSWWKWLQKGESFKVDEKNNKLIFTASLFKDSTIKDGSLLVSVECYDGQTTELTLQIQNGTVTTKGSNAK